jgi:hypothetical protein
MQTPASRAAFPLPCFPRALRPLHPPRRSRPRRRRWRAPARPRPRPPGAGTRKNTPWRLQRGS